MKHEFRFPDIGEGIHEGTLTKWLVKKGDNVNEGDSLVEVETDKVTTEIPAPKSGTIAELKNEEGDTIHVGDVFIVIDTEGGKVEESSKDQEVPEAKEEDKKKEKDEKEEVVEEETAGVVGEVVASSNEIPASDEADTSSKRKEKKGGKILATPVARKLAKDLGVDIQSIEGTGPAGRVMKEDIRNASKDKDAPKKSKETKKQFAKPLSQPEDTSEKEERIPLSRIRQTIAEKMSESRFTIPHTTAMDEIDVTELYQFRKDYKDKLGSDVSLTFLPFIIKAVIIGLKEYPEFNSSLDEDAKELVLKHYYNIGIATDTDRGLMVPVLENADKKSIVDIAKGIEDLSTRARDNKLELSELRGSTFSVTNYGSIGGMFGIPIINYPESAILGLGRIVEKPVVVDGRITIRRMLPLSLSYDHRIIDGASGAKLLNVLKDLLMDPEVLLLKA
jgi:pyruvate dehydrogenase E2 component (dihydrolipoyllysine-residue acetyltransferase)